MSENWWQPEIHIVINDKSQGSIAMHLSCDGYFITNLSFNLLVKEFCQWTFGEVMGKMIDVASHCTELNNVYRGWRRINQTTQPFNEVYENLHKIMPLTLVSHWQIRRPEKKCAFKYSAVINIICDVIADVVYVNIKTCPLTSDCIQLYRLCYPRRRHAYTAPTHEAIIVSSCYIIAADVGNLPTLIC